ncbi:hypothetical protein [Algoriphagus sanaruensis]|uniref:Uncharacterized protein n=1 Tax=Algoriphagus sanaruensis TaxID=1727163 RepID=A0A142EQK8_9BACT|nr:hypothetical protein [Algoriphagus sanaruensis]AMQ57413.1 hypothetical protein AO498_13275 [Algoriphagus sanaruensis]
MTRSFCLLLFLYFVGGIPSFAQEKFEREVKVKSSIIPVKASSWLSYAFDKARKVKWYEEYSQEGKSFEAKFWRQDQFYSVEFDSTGNLIDVEVEIREDEIQTISWEKVQLEFSENFQGHKILKIQKQYIGDMSQLATFFQNREVAEPQIRYEIVFEGKKEFWRLWEGLFDESGALISLIPVQQRFADNLIF